MPNSFTHKRHSCRGFSDSETNRHSHVNCPGVAGSSKRSCAFQPQPKYHRFMRAASREAVAATNSAVESFRSPRLRLATRGPRFVLHCDSLRFRPVSDATTSFSARGAPPPLARPEPIARTARLRRDANRCSRPIPAGSAPQSTCERRRRAAGTTPAALAAGRCVSRL